MKFIRVVKASREIYDSYMFEIKNHIESKCDYCAVARINKSDFKKYSLDKIIYEGILVDDLNYPTKEEKVQILGFEDYSTLKPILALYNAFNSNDVGYVKDLNKTKNFDSTANKYFVLQ